MSQNVGFAESTLGKAQNNTHPKWWKDPGLRRLNILLLGPMLGSMGFGYDSALIGGLLANKKWFADMALHSASLQGLTIAALAFGGLVAFVPAAILVDIIGRRWSLILSNIVLIAGIVGQSFTTSAVQFLGTRLLIGFALFVVSVAAPTLCAELAHPRQRGVITAMYMTFFYVGSITAAWTCYGSLSIKSSWTWRLPVLLQVFWSLVQMVLLYIGPESPRWLAVKGRETEAREILVRYHANNIGDDEMVEMEFQEILSNVHHEFEDATIGLRGWIALFSTRPNIKRAFLVVFLGLGSQWVGNGIVSYYFAPILATVGIASASQQQGINGGLQIFNWFMSVTGASLAERCGRKALLLASSIGMLIFMVLVTICSAVYAKSTNDGSSGNSSAGIAVIVFLFLFFGAYDIGFTPIPPLYVTELAPTNLRAKYSSLYWFSTVVALCFNQYVNPIAENAIHWKYYIVYIAVLTAVITLIYFFAPETKGLSLEEVSAIFDPHAAVEIEHAVEIAKTHLTEEKQETAVETREYA